MEASGTLVEYFEAAEKLSGGSFSKAQNRYASPGVKVSTRELREYYEAVWSRFPFGSVGVGVPYRFHVFSFPGADAFRSYHASRLSLEDERQAVASFGEHVLLVRDAAGCADLCAVDLKTGYSTPSRITSLAELFRGLAYAIREGGFRASKESATVALPSAPELFRKFAGPEAIILWD